MPDLAKRTDRKWNVVIRKGSWSASRHFSHEEGRRIESGGVKQMVELVSIRPISNIKTKTAAWKWKGGVDGGLDGSECVDGLDVEE